jgi:hypothetical protein
VSLMGKIYSAADRVLIHVGTDEDSQCSALASLLDDVDAMIQSTLQDIDMSWDSFPYPGEDDPLLATPRWEALYALLSKDWFDRGWVRILMLKEDDG